MQRNNSQTDMGCELLQQIRRISPQQMINLDIKMEYNFEALSQQLKNLQDAWFENPKSENLDEVRLELMEELAAAYDKSQQSNKGKRRRKKNKKEAEEERAATQQLTRIIESMLTHNEKYHNVKKNLTRLADKIDCSEILYAILNPLVTKQIQGCVEQSLLGNRTESQQVDAIATLYGHVQQGMSQIQKVFTFLMEANVDSFECSEFAEKVVVYLLLHYPEFIPTFADWKKYTPKEHTQTVATMLVLSELIPGFEQLAARGGLESSRKKIQEKTDEFQDDDNDQDKQSVDSERDSKQLEFLQNATVQHSRLDVCLDQQWLRQLSDSLRRQTRLI